MNKERYCVVVSTFPTKKEAKKAAKKLLKERLAACAQISKIKSLYHWEGKIERSKEYQLKLKSRVDNFVEIEQELSAIHPYETPQIVMLPIVGANSSYLEWIDKELGGGDI